MSTLRRSAYTAIVANLAFAASLHAQANAPAKSTTDASGEETLELSPFEVSSQAERGYVASETLTGTRVATQIKDLPYTVNVLTSEYFEDFGIFQLDDTLTQIGGLTQLDIGGGFNLRGFSSSSQLRDGFYRLGRYGQTNIDRVEIIKGPNAGIYGRTSPGGMVNMISKAPKKKEEIKLTARYGTFDTSQGTLEATGSITPNTYYILTLSQFNRGFDVPISHIRENQGFLAIKHDFKDNAHLLVSAEYFLQIRHSPTNSAPLIMDRSAIDPLTGSVDFDTKLNPVGQAVGFAKNLARYNASGPFSELNRGSITYLAAYDKRISDIWTIRAAVQDFRARRWDYNQNNSWGTVAINSPVLLASPATAGTNESYTSTRGGTPNKGLIQEDGGGFQFDNVFSYKLFNGAVTNKTLVTLDFNDYYRWDPTWSTSKDATLNTWSGNSVATGRTVFLDTSFRPTGPITYFPEWFQWGSETLTRLTRRRTTVGGGQFRQESHWLSDRLLTYFGARYDHVRFNEREYLTKFTDPVTGQVYTPNVNAPTIVKRTVTQTKPNVGVLYKVTNSFRVYANYSESYFVNQTDNPNDILSSQYAPETAKGGDYGIKGSFFEDRLNFTIGAYYIARYNVRVTDRVEFPAGSGTFVDITRADGNQLDRGIEADVNWNITKEYSTGLSVGHVNAKYTAFGSRFPEAVGRDVAGISPENGSVYFKYSPSSGFLKGFSANINATFVTSTPTQSPTAGDTTTANPNGTVAYTSSTGEWKLKVPGYTLWNLGVHYHWRSGTRFDNTISVNVNNLFDKDYLKVGKNIGDGRAVYASYTLGLEGLLHH